MKYTKIIITGGSSGLGLALAKRYAKTGAQVAIVARNRVKLDSAASEIAQQTGNNILTKAVDVSDATQAKLAITELIADLGGLDLLINSAGILKEGYFENLSIDVFQQVMAINLFGVINVSQTCLPALKASQGKIANIASLGGFVGAFGYTAYSSSKFALIGFSDALRYELKPQGVRVQLICPPEFDSPMVDELDISRSPENRAQVLTIPKSPVDLIADSTVKAIEGSEFIHFTGIKTKVIGFFARHFSAILRAYSDKVIAKHYVQR